jgi:RNA polymerase sigma-70 factor (ECF subfamily)
VDRNLVELARTGDRDAFASLVHQVSDPLFAVAFRILRDRDLAQDAFQNALIAAWRQLPGLRDVDRFEAWVRRILVHECYAESRRRTRWSANIRVLELDAPSGEEASLSIHDRDELERGFGMLPLEQRAVFVLHHYVGLPLVEIAETLGIPAGTARSRLHYATRALREALGEGDSVAATKERLA